MISQDPGAQAPDQIKKIKKATSCKRQAPSVKRLKFATMIFNKDIQKEIKNYVKKRS